MAGDRAAAAWAFELDLWGHCGQGPDEEDALRALCHDLGTGVKPIVVERISGDEQAFLRDLQPAEDAEREITLAILAGVREETVALVTSSGAAVLDFDDPTRTMPTWARWRTLRQMAWHVADTESRYYLPALGLPGIGRARSDNRAPRFSQTRPHHRVDHAGDADPPHSDRGVDDHQGSPPSALARTLRTDHDALPRAPRQSSDPRLAILIRLQPAHQEHPSTSWPADRSIAV
jgi:hypothetical protein